MPATLRHQPLSFCSFEWPLEHQLPRLLLHRSTDFDRNPNHNPFALEVDEPQLEELVALFLVILVRLGPKMGVR